MGTNKSEINYIIIIIHTATSGKPIAVWSQSISGISAVDPSIAFYDIHRRKREVLLFYFVPDTTRDTR
jgi:hypothetical protein